MTPSRARDEAVRALAARGLGLRRDGTVRLLPHDTAWAEAFALEARRLLEALRAPTLQLHHVGSTAIPGIPAKPILDILLVAPALAEVDEREPILEALGYECKGEYGIAGRRYCVLYGPDGPDGERGYVHLHAFAAGSAEAEQHLLFRDYLRSCPERARDYGALKERLGTTPGLTRTAYTEAKGPLIGELLGEARRWRAG